MTKIMLAISLVLSGVIALGSAHAGTGKATTLMTKELPDFPGKEGMVEACRVRARRSVPGPSA